MTETGKGMTVVGYVQSGWVQTVSREKGNGTALPHARAHARAGGHEYLLHSVAFRRILSHSTDGEFGIVSWGALRLGVE